MCYAASNGHLQIVQYLALIPFTYFLDENDQMINRTLNLERVDIELLYNAVRGNSLPMVQWLLEANIIPEPQTHISRAIELAIRKHYNDIAIFLITTYRYTNYFAIHAASNNNVELIHFLVNSQYLTTVNDDLLVAAAESGNLELVTYLLSMADEDILIMPPNKPYKKITYQRMLVNAAQTNSLDIFLYILSLVENAVIPELVVDIAASSGSISIMEYIVENNIELIKGNNSLIYNAATEGHLEMVQYLVSLQLLDPFYQDGVALQESIFRGRQDVVNYLKSIRPPHAKPHSKKRHKRKGG
jgi:hypothetical protein